MGRVTFLPLDTTDRATITPAKGEMSILTPTDDNTRRVNVIRDKRNGATYELDAPYIMKEFSGTKASAATLFGPFGANALVRLKDLVKVTVGGVLQPFNAYNLCNSSGTTVSSGTATYIKFTSNVPANVPVVVRFPAQLSYGTLA